MKTLDQLSQRQAIIMLEEIESALKSIVSNSSEVAQSFSPDPISRLTYQTRYLSGGISAVLDTIQAYKE